MGPFDALIDDAESLRDECEDSVPPDGGRPVDGGRYEAAWELMTAFECFADPSVTDDASARTQMIAFVRVALTAAGFTAPSGANGDRKLGDWLNEIRAAKPH